MSLEEPFALRSEWLENILQLFSLKMERNYTRSRFEIKSQNSGFLRGATIHQGPITWKKIVSIVDNSTYVEWFGTISTSNELDAKHRGVRADGTVESWREKLIPSTSILERKFLSDQKTVHFTSMT